MQKTTIEEIKKLAQTIAKLPDDQILLHENAVVSLYEQFVILKYLDANSNEIVESQQDISVQTDKTAKAVDVVNLKETILELPKVKQTEIEELPIPKIPTQHISKKLSIDLNDRIGFINVLFDGDKNNYELIINTLDMVNDFAESQKLIDNLKIKYDWQGEKEEFAERLIELNLKRFE